MDSAGREASLSGLEKIGQIALTVDDLERAKNFYQNVLGIKMLFEAGHLAFFQCGDIRLMLSTPDKAAPRGGTILYFKVADIDSAYTRLRERGAQFIDRPHLIARMGDHDLWMVFLKDTEDNTLGLMCERHHSE